MVVRHAPLQQRHDVAVCLELAQLGHVPLQVERCIPVSARCVARKEALALTALSAPPT